MNMMQEALAAIDGQIKTSPAKIPEGKTLVAIKLDRDPEHSGRFMCAVTERWMAPGMAVAIKNGHVVRANYVFGRFTAGTAKATACQYVTCATCGERVLMPLAVWEAKDAARRQGINIPSSESGMSTLRKYGRHSCGGIWYIDAEKEKTELDEEAVLLSKKLVETEGLKRLKNRRISTRQLLISQGEVKARTEETGDLVRSAREFLEDYRQETERLSRGRRLINLLAVIGAAAGVIGIPAAYEKIKSRFWRSFLAYVPYTVLSAMTVPAIFFATDSRITGACALLAAVVASLLGGGLVTVAAVSCLTVLGVDGLMLLTL